MRDLLFHFPSRYDQAGGGSEIAKLELGQEATLVGTLEKLETKKSWKSRVPMSEGYLRDQSGRIKLMWFNQPYIAKMYMNDTHVRATGKVTGSAGKLYLANPSLEKISVTEENLFEAKQNPVAEPATSEGSAQPSMFAVYPETRGVTSLWFRHAIKKIVEEGAVAAMQDSIPADILKRYNLPTLQTALIWMHTPEKLKDAEAARKRFAFEEVFFIQLERGIDRKKQLAQKSFAGFSGLGLHKCGDVLLFRRAFAECLLCDVRSFGNCLRLLGNVCDGGF